MDVTLNLRPITSEDRDFIYRVYASTREGEMALLAWNDAQKEAFLTMQFEAQHRHYVEQFVRAQFQIVELNGEPIGRLYVDRRTDEIHVIDIALLPEHRNQGIGSRLLKELLDKGARAGLPVRIYVEHFNPALHWYTRLGFRKIDDSGVYYLMEWTPPAGK